MLPCNHAKGTPFSCHFVPRLEKLCSRFFPPSSADKMQGHRNGRSAEASSRMTSVVDRNSHNAECKWADEEGSWRLRQGLGSVFFLQ